MRPDMCERTVISLYVTTILVTHLRVIGSSGNHVLLSCHIFSMLIEVNIP